MYSRIIGCGGYLPQKIVTNFDFQKSLNTSDEWIKTRTGISQRHVAASDEETVTLAYHAAVSAILDAKILFDDIDLIVVSTNTSDRVFPSVANYLQKMLSDELCKAERRNIPSFDIQAVCSGFLYGLDVADSFIRSGKYNTVLLVCADKMSSILDWNDRSTCVLFGDGAGAVILQRVGQAKANTFDRVHITDDDDDICARDRLISEKCGILDINIHSDGRLSDILYVDGGALEDQGRYRVKMNGSAVYKEACNKMLECTEQILGRNNISVGDIDFFIPHQANVRIVNHIAEQLGMNMDRVVVTVDKHANCSAASIPLALFDLRKRVDIKDGAMILFASFGAGATWGACLLKW